MVVAVGGGGEIAVMKASGRGGNCSEGGGWYRQWWCW